MTLTPEALQSFESLVWALTWPSLLLGFACGLFVGPWVFKRVAVFLARITWPYRIRVRRKLMAAVRRRAERLAP